MLALENATDRAVYDTLARFNKQFIDLVSAVFKHPRDTEAAAFHFDLIGNFDTIQREALAARPHTMAMADIDQVQHTMLRGSPGWQVLWIKAFGQPIDNPCPHLTSIVEGHPEIFNVMLSCLEPGMELPQHQGPFKGVLRYHLGLKVPERGDLGLVVHGQTYRWGEGRGVVFDDTLWHRAWNHTNEERIVLFADVLRTLPPQLAAQREQLIQELTASQGLATILGSIRRASLVERQTHRA